MAEIDRYSDRYRTNKRANRVPLNSVLKLTGASFPVELLGQGHLLRSALECSSVVAFYFSSTQYVWLWV